MNDDLGRRRLLLMRHAKASAYSSDDHGRDLTEGGRLDAVETGRWLAEEALVPTGALVSSAARTTQTWQAVVEGSGSTARAGYEAALYSAGPDSALEVLHGADSGIETLMLVGHNPTVAYLAQLLSDGRGDDGVLRRMAAGYPPSALTVFDVPVPWAELGEGVARVTGFHVGRG